MYRAAIRTVVRQRLRDEFKESQDYEFAPDELDLYINEVGVSISEVRPYESKVTVTSDGTREVDLSEISGLLRVERAEYPTGNYPPDYRNVIVFGNTLTLDIDAAPTSGDDIYLYCLKSHELTDSSSTLSADLETVLITGVVAKAAMAWLNQMRSQIVPASVRWYENWSNNQFLIYQKGLVDIVRPRSWVLYPRT